MDGTGSEGVVDGDMEGLEVGPLDPAIVGDSVGHADGSDDGNVDGASVGVLVGLFVGLVEGSVDGTKVGDDEGISPVSEKLMVSC